MDINAEIALAQQAHRKLSAMRPPALVSSWRPDETQKKEYVRLAEKVTNLIDKLGALEARQLLSEGKIHSFIPESLFTFVRDTLRPDEVAIRGALDFLDPEGKLLRDFLGDMNRPSGLGQHVRSTFEQGLQEIYNLIDRNPDLDLDERFFPDTAYEVLESKLITFEPDAWLDRAGELSPVRTGNQNLVLPAHVRLRLEELYRTYIFGCWLSVLSISRAILEYSLLDNASKFGIETSWPPDQYGKRREKKLSHLIEDISPVLPNVAMQMSKIRDFGNDYLHPKRSQTSKETLFARQSSARETITVLIQAVEAIYAWRKEA